MSIPSLAAHFLSVTRHIFVGEKVKLLVASESAMDVSRCETDGCPLRHLLSPLEIVQAQLHEMLEKVAGGLPQERRRATVDLNGAAARSGWDTGQQRERVDADRSDPSQCALFAVGQRI